MIKILLLEEIKRAKKNTRWLVKDETGNYASVLLNSNEYYEKGSIIEAKESDLEEAHEKWIKRLSIWSKKKVKVLNHLIDYKLNVLQIVDEGFWESSDGQIHYYPHILTEGDYLKNVIPSKYRISIENAIAAKESEIHKGFKNLNSSQAFAFNFFQPIIDENLFNEFLNTTDYGANTKPEFEKLNDDNTEFDFYISCGEKSASFEVKYTEDTFGDAPMDESHIKKWNEVYKREIENLIGKDLLPMEDFFENYQLWRNILFTKNKNHQTYFIYPKFRRDELDSKINTILQQFPVLKENVHIIYVDTFVEEILSNEYSELLKTHYSIFKEKYLNINF